MNFLQKPKAVLFDWDGTLVDSLDAIVESYGLVRDYFCEPRVPLDELYTAMARGTSRDTFEYFYPGQQEKIAQALDVYYTHVPNLRAQHLMVVPGGLAVVEKLHTAGIRVGIVSNVKQAILDNEMAKLGWRDYFEVTTGAVDGLAPKPNPDPIFRALDAMGLSRTDAKDVWFVGDTAADAGAARGAGCPFLYYTGALAQGRAPEKLGETVQFADYQQLLHRIDDLFVAA